MTSASAFGFAAHSYDAVMVLASAIKQANSTEGPKIREALENLQTPYDGMMKSYDKPFSKTEHEALRSKGLQMDPLAGRQTAALQRPGHQVAHRR